MYGYMSIDGPVLDFLAVQVQYHVYLDLVNISQLYTLARA